MTKNNVVEFKDREPIPDAQYLEHPELTAEVGSGKSQTGTALDLASQHLRRRVEGF